MHWSIKQLSDAVLHQDATDVCAHIHVTWYGCSAVTCVTLSAWHSAHIWILFNSGSKARSRKSAQQPVAPLLSAAFIYIFSHFISFYRHESIICGFSLPGPILNANEADLTAQLCSFLICVFVYLVWLWCEQKEMISAQQFGNRRWSTRSNFTQSFKTQNLIIIKIMTFMLLRLKQTWHQKNNGLSPINIRTSLVYILNT